LTVSVFSTIFVISSVEDILEATLSTDMAFIVIAESDGSFVASSLNYTEILESGQSQDSGYYRNMSRTNHTELITMEQYILYQTGGWNSIYNVSTLSYYSPSFGAVTVVKNVYAYANRQWYVLCVWPNVSCITTFISHCIVSVYATSECQHWY
jgi:hypothetical protein